MKADHCASPGEISGQRLSLEEMYFLNRKVSLNQRFLFRRERHSRLESARADQRSAILADWAEGHRDFGMDTDSRSIRFEDWSKESVYSQESYQPTAEGVIYRQVEFLPGDVFLCNRTDDSDGIFTTLVEGEQSFAHAAIFAMLEKDGCRYPAAVEIHHEGVRAVPLNVYLSDRFNSYVETYRHEALTTELRNRINAESLRILGETHGFSIYMEENQEHYLSCAMTVSLIFARAGVGSIAGKSRYSLKTEPNLKVLGVSSCANRDLLMPDDFAKNPNFVLAGAVDNGRFFEVTGRMLARERIRSYWQTRRMRRRRFPMSFPVAWLLLRSVQWRIPRLSPMAANLIGFTVDNFPSGPATFIALTPLAEERMKKASVRIAEALKNDHGGFLSLKSLDDVHESDDIRALVESSLAEFRKFYGEKERS
ncbi:MAG: hypothetical protein KF789_06950 [Bdellovibrionaceae bacterium]|nr:hypothetical protein [Pseudobdellovibrionaceae bacterium]